MKCERGYYCPNKNMRLLFECPKGSYCPIGVYSPIICPKGSYCPREKLSIPVKCPSNTYCPNEGMIIPIKCQLGYNCDVGTIDFNMKVNKERDL